MEEKYKTSEVIIPMINNMIYMKPQLNNFEKPIISDEWLLMQYRESNMNDVKAQWPMAEWVIMRVFFMQIIVLIIIIIDRYTITITNTPYVRQCRRGFHFELQPVSCLLFCHMYTIYSYSDRYQLLLSTHVIQIRRQSIAKRVLSARFFKDRSVHSNEIDTRCMNSQFKVQANYRMLIYLNVW